MSNIVQNSRLPDILSGRKEMKRFGNLVFEKLSENPVSYQSVLEAIAHGYGLKDWNTLSAGLSAKNKHSITNTELSLNRTRPDTDTDTAVRMISAGTPENFRGTIVRLNDPINSSASKPEYYRLNPFDTLPLCRKPGKMHHTLLVRLLMLILEQNREWIVSPEDMNACSMIVDQVYAIYSDMSRTGRPKHYEPESNPELHKHILKTGITIPEDTTWWWVTDTLMKADYPELSRRAQAYAAPELTDIPMVRSALPSSVRDITAPISRTVRQCRLLQGPTTLWLEHNVQFCLNVEGDDTEASYIEKQEISANYLAAAIALSGQICPDKISERCMPPWYLNSHRENIRNMKIHPGKMVSPGIEDIDFIAGRILRNHCRENGISTIN